MRTSLHPRSVNISTIQLYEKALKRLVRWAAVAVVVVAGCWP